MFLLKDELLPHLHILSCGGLTPPDLQSPSPLAQQIMPPWDRLPSPALPALPLNLSLRRTLAGQHIEWDLHLGLIGLCWEISLSEQLHGSASVLLLHTLLKVLRNLE